MISLPEKNSNLTTYLGGGTTQAKIAENIGTSPSYVNKIVRSKEQIMNKTFLAMMEDLGFDVELHYVEREDKK